MSEQKVEIQVYKKRWLVQVSVCFIYFWIAFHYCMYAVVNNIVVSYFDISYATADWMVSGSFVGVLCALPIIAWLSFKQLISFRILMCVACLCLQLNTIFSIVAFNKPKFFELIIIGQSLVGIAMAASLPIMTSLAELWFSESQIGISVGLVIFSSSLATILANSLIPSFVYVENHSDNNKTLFISKLFNQRKSNMTNSWVINDKTVYEAILSSELAMVFLVLIFIIVFVPEKPERPPSFAQYQKRFENNRMNSNNQSFLSFEQFLKETAWLMNEKVFTLCSLSNGIVFTTTDIEALTMQQILHENFKEILHLPIDVQAGLVIVCYSLGSSVGNLISGKILDRFKQYYIQSCCGTGCFVIFTVVGLLSVYFHSIAALFVSFIFIGCSTRISMVSLIDSVMQHTYPKNVLFVSSWMNFVQSIYSLVVIVIGRQVFNHVSSVGMLSFIVGVKFVGFIFCLLGKPKTKRLTAEYRQSTESEETRLVDN